MSRPDVAPAPRPAGLFLNQPYRVCRECGARVAEETFYGFREPVTVLRCVVSPAHAGHTAAVSVRGGGPGRAA